MPRAFQSNAACHAFTYALWLVLAATSPDVTLPQQPPPASTQQPTPQATPPPANTPDAVFRVTTDLVQADVIVLDRQGRFVDNLQQDDFELRVDDAPHPISFFERLSAGPVQDGAQLPAAGVGTASSAQPGEAAARPADARRTVLFFVDDFHLAHASLERARRLVTNFVDREMGLDDLAAIASTSGQVGFLQQLTSNKAALRAAVARLKSPVRAIIDDMGRPSMTAHQAHAIESRTDRDLLEFFINETIRQYPFMTRDSAESTVVGRALRIVEQSNAISMNTLMALEEIVRSLAELPGRKVVFFVSDGFVLNLRGSNASNRLQRIADAAARSRVVIYTMDGRGLVSQPDFDASRPAVSDATGAVSRSNADEINSSQAPLYRLAADSGGRALINSNALVDIVPQALQETSRYYLLGWTPRQQEDQEERQNNRFHRIEVSVRGRPELTVRVPRGFYGTQPPADEAAPASSRRRRQSATPATPAASEAEAALISTLRSRHPVTTLPMTLSLRFFDMPATGAVLTGTAHLNATTLDFGASDGNAGQAVVDVISAVFNDQGQSVSDVKERLTISPPSSSTTPRATSGRVTYSHQFQLKPGLYQVRVAARDTTTGRAGSAMEWIEIPDLSSGPFTMSSLILGEIAPGTSQNETDAASIPPMEVNANHHFRRAPRLRLLAYLYNVSRSAAPPDVALRIQVFRDDRPVIASPLSPLRTEGIADLSRIPYFAELNMEGMPSGGYVLQVMAIDRATNSTTSQQASFDIE